MSAGRPVVGFDHHSAEYARDWPKLTRDVRQVCPVAYTESYGGFWVVTGFEEARGIAIDDARFSSGRVNGVSSL